MQHPEAPPPPLIERPPDASEHALRLHWPLIEDQVEQAQAHLKQLGPLRGTTSEDIATGWLARTVQELDQYARAIRWVLTVTER